MFTFWGKSSHLMMKKFRDIRNTWYLHSLFLVDPISLCKTQRYTHHKLILEHKANQLTFRSLNAQLLGKDLINIRNLLRLLNDFKSESWCLDNFIAGWTSNQETNLLCYISFSANLNSTVEVIPLLINNEALRVR